MPKQYQDTIAGHLTNEFGEWLSDEEITLFVELHDEKEFTGVDEVSGAEFLNSSYLTGYAQSYFASQLEDAGYFEDVV